MDNRVLIVLPTYNEAENIRPILARIRAAVPTATILVMDDNSPDGTGDILDELAQADALLLVRHRPGKGGLGAAYLDGFRWGLERKRALGEQEGGTLGQLVHVLRPHFQHRHGLG